MPIFEKIDMERHRRDINLCKPVSQPDATGYSGVEPDENRTIPSPLFADFSEEHSTPATATIARAPQKPAISRDKEV